MVRARNRASGVQSHGPAFDDVAPYDGPADDDARTVEDVPPLAVPQRRTGRPGSRSPQPVWGAAPEWPSSRGGRGSRVLVGLLVALIVLVVGVGGVWGMILRPQLHQQIDGAVRAQITAMVTTVNHQPLIPSTTATFTAATATQSLQQRMPASVPIQNIQVAFSGGRVTVSFTTDGFDGAVSTQLVARNGRLVAVATEVDGPMALVETGSDLETALNASLGGLRTDITVQQVTLDKNVMAVSVKGNVPGQ